MSQSSFSMIWLDQKVLELTLPVTMNSFALTKIFESIFCRPLSQSLTAVESALVNESESGSAVAFWIERLQPTIFARQGCARRALACLPIRKHPSWHHLYFYPDRSVAKPPWQTAPVVPSDRDSRSGPRYVCAPAAINALSHAMQCSGEPAQRPFRVAWTS